MKRKCISRAWIIAALAVLMIPSMKAAAADVTPTTKYNENILVNPAPSSKEGWRLENAADNYRGFNNTFTFFIFGTNAKDQTTAAQDIKLDKRTQQRVNQGEITFSASGKFYSQGSRTGNANLDISFNGGDTVTAHRSEFNFVRYAVWTLTHNDRTVPAGTSVIEYKARMGLGSGALDGGHGVYDFSFILHDNTAPTLKGAAVLTSPGTYKIGDSILLRAEISEGINVINGGTLSTTAGDAKYIGYGMGGDDDIGQYLYYRLDITDAAPKGDKIEIIPTRLTGAEVTDDAGNSSGVINASNNMTGNGVYYDNKQPALVSAELVRVNGSTSLPERLLPSDTVVYQFTFDENITYAEPLPTLSFSVDGDEKTVVPTVNTVSNNALTFTIQLPDWEKNGNLVLTGISGLHLSDTIGNTAEISQTGLSIEEKAYKSVFSISSTLTNLTLSGDDSVKWHRPWSGMLIPFAGYHAPDGISVNMGGAPLTVSCTDGAISIAENLIDDDITITADGVPNEYTVILDAQGGSGGGSITATFSKNMPDISLPDRPGYAFLGYFTQKNGEGAQYYDANGVSLRAYDLTDEITLYADWKPIHYTIQLYSQRQYVKTLFDVEYGILILPTAEELGLIRENYTFVGWNSFDEQDWAMYTAGQMYPTGLATREGQTVYLYAAWRAADNSPVSITVAPSGTGYTVTYDGEEVTETRTISKPRGQSFTFDITILEHYNADDLQVYSNGALLNAESADGNRYTYTIENLSSNQVIMIRGVKANVYTVTFRVDGKIYRTAQAVYGSLLSEPLPPVRDGRIFDGWYFGEHRWDFETDIVKGNTELLPHWEEKTYTVTLPPETDAYSVQADDENPVAHGGSYGFSVSLKDGYNGKNMRVYANGVFLDAISADGNMYTYLLENITENKVITVRGTGADSFCITYQPNTSEYVGNMPAGQVKMYGEAVVISEKIPERRGYTFAGWATDENGEAIYSPESEYTDDADISLYAVWTANTYSVTLISNGGTINDEEITSYTYGIGARLPSDVTKPGCRFIGWYENRELEGVHVTEILTTDIGDKTYYAGFTPGDVALEGYSGVYDGKAHTIGFTVPDGISDVSIHWYFKAAGMNGFASVPGDTASKDVTDVAQSGEYYCMVEGTENRYAVRFITQTAVVLITPKPITVTAGSAKKVFDNIALTDDTYNTSESMIEGHSLTVTMTADSSITNVGTAENVIETVIISDAQMNDVTLNYEITKENGKLEITPLILSADGNSIRKTTGSELTLEELYTINGILDGANLTLANTTITITDSAGTPVPALSDITKSVGNYTVKIDYNGFEGEGSGNYAGSGTVTSKVEVYRRSSGGSGGGGSSFRTYTVTFEFGNGEAAKTVKVSGNTMLSEPDAPVWDGHLFDGWYTDMEYTEKYDFTKKVTKSFTLYARWTEIPAENEVCDGTAASNCPSLAFDDLDTSKWYHLGVDYALTCGLMKGYGDRLFGPNDELTRAMLVTILYRREGCPKVNTENGFADVAKDSYYADAVDWAQKYGIVVGYSDTEFAPDDPVLREQIAAMLYRYAIWKGENGSADDNASLLSYTDADEISEYAVSAMRYVVGSGIMIGRTNTTLNPRKTTTRAEIATLLWRYFEAGGK